MSQHSGSLPPSLGTGHSAAWSAPLSHARSSIHAPSVLAVGYSLRQVVVCALIGSVVAALLVILKLIHRILEVLSVILMSYALGCGISCFLVKPKLDLAAVKYLIRNHAAEPFVDSLSNALSCSDAVQQFWSKGRVFVCLLILIKLVLNMYAFVEDLIYLYGSPGHFQTVSDLVVIVEASMFSSLVLSVLGFMMSPISGIPGRRLSLTWFRNLCIVLSWRQIPIASVMKSIKTLSGFSSLTFLRQLNIGHARSSFSRYWTLASRGRLCTTVSSMLLMVILYASSVLFGILALIVKIQMLDIESFSRNILEPLNHSRLPILFTASNFRILVFANQVAALMNPDEFEIYSILLYCFAEVDVGVSDETFAFVDTFMESYYDAFILRSRYCGAWRKLIVVVSLSPADLRRFCRSREVEDTDSLAQISRLPSVTERF